MTPAADAEVPRISPLLSPLAAQTGIPAFAALVAFVYDAPGFTGAAIGFAPQR